MNSLKNLQKNKLMEQLRLIMQIKLQYNYQFNIIIMELGGFDESLRLYSSAVKSGLLGEARKAVASIPYKDRLQIARDQFFNALEYKAPRLDFLFINKPVVFRMAYKLQTSNLWSMLLILLSYAFMYLILITHRKPQSAQAWLQVSILSIFWLDVTMEIYHKSDIIIRERSKYQYRFYLKIITLLLLTTDQILAMNLDNSQRFIRYFLVCRCFLPVIYDTTLRKNLYCLLALYKDILVFTFFYASVIIIIAIIAKLEVSHPIKTNDYDQFKQNYFDIGRGIFLIYALSSFEGFPDNQMKAIEAHPAIVIFFLAFILLNLFLFITIPTSLLFKQFKDVRSKIILVSEMKQQSSLIVAFACLCDQDFQIGRNKFIQFLWLCFRNKLGYFDQMTQIFMEVDQNKNQKIQITQFMQICKIINSHRSLYPPMFDDWQPWIAFRAYINQKFGLKDFFLSIEYKVFGTVFVIFAIINSLLDIFVQWPIFQVIDFLVAVIFLIELVLKLIALGPENYFRDPWNKVDFFVILVIFISEILNLGNSNQHANVLLKLTRAYRIALLPQYLFDKTKYLNLSNITVKISRLITQTLMTIPIIVQFFPMYLFFFYLFGVIGLWIFGNVQAIRKPQESPYSTYYEASNFDSFLYSQFYMVQILIEGGWSLVCFDYAYRYSVPQSCIMLFFAATHFTITLIVSSLIKGVTWQVYEKIEKEINMQEGRQLKKMKQEKQRKQEKQILEQVRNQINLKQSLHLQNLITRQIYQQKADQQILAKMNEAALDQQNDYMMKKAKDNKRQNLVPFLIKDLSLIVDEIQLEKRPPSKDKGALSFAFPDNRPPVLKKQQSNATDTLDLHDNLDEQIQKLISKAVIDGKHPYSQTVIYPKLLINFLEKKLKSTSEYSFQQSTKIAQQTPVSSNAEQDVDMVRSKFNIKEDHFDKNGESMSFLTDSLKEMLQVKSSERQLKNRVILGLMETKTLNQQQAETLIQKKKMEKGMGIDPTYILRQTFLSNTSQKLVKKFQVQYFSNLYGKGFKQVNQNTIQPLLRLQAKLTYCLRNALRYRQINQTNFFQILNQIEDVISSKLLTKGSLFKFIYQIDSLNQTWFSIQVLQNHQIKVRFIKNGIWVWHSRMKQKQVYVGKDLFYWKDIQQQTVQILAQSLSKNNHYLSQRFIKMLFQSFQTLGLCLPTDKNFFIGEPQKYQYDLYCQFLNTEQTKRVIDSRFSISKIMVVILTNEGERKDSRNEPQHLKYQLTDLKLKSNQAQKQTKKYDLRVKKMTLERFSKVQTMQQQEIQQDEKLPHAFVLNLMKQIQDILNTYSENFIDHLQNLLNKDKFRQSVPMSNMSNMSNGLGFLSRKQSYTYNNQNSPTIKKKSPKRTLIIPNSQLYQSLDLSISESDNQMD